MLLKVVCKPSRVVSVASGRSSELAAPPVMRVESYCISAGGLNGREEERVSGGARREAAGGGTPEQANAADREDGGIHPRAWMVVPLCARRLIAGVRLMPADSAG